MTRAQLLAKMPTIMRFICLIALLLLPTMSFAYTIQTEIDFFETVAQEVDAQLGKELQEGTGLKVFLIDGHYYAIFPGAEMGIQAALNNPDVYLNFYVGRKSREAGLILSSMFGDGSGPDFYQRISRRKDALSKNTVRPISLDRFVQIKHGVPAPACPNPIACIFLDSFDKLYLAANSNSKGSLISFFYWKSLEQVFGAVGAGGITSPKEFVDAFFQNNLIQDETALKKLYEHRFYRTYLKIKVQDQKAVGCLQVDSITDSLVLEVSLEECVNEKGLDYEFTDDGRCQAYIEGYAIGEVPINKCQDQGVRGKPFPGPTVCRKTGGPKVTYQACNPTPQTFPSGVVAPRSGYTLFRGVGGDYVGYKMHELILMLLGDSEHYIMMKKYDGSNQQKMREKADQGFSLGNYQNPKARFEDTSESIYCSVFPETACRYSGGVVFMIEDLYRRSQDIGYHRKLAGQYPDNPGEVLMPIYITQEELVGLIFNEIYQAAVKVKEGGRNYLLLYSNTSNCFFRQGNKIMKCRSGNNNDEFSAPVVPEGEASAIGVVALCPASNQDCKLPEGFFKRHNVKSVGKFAKETSFFNQDVLNELNGQKPKFFYYQ